MSQFKDLPNTLSSNEKEEEGITDTNKKPIEDYEDQLENLTLEEGENMERPSPLIPKELVFDSKLIQYISEYRDEIKMKSRDYLLECEAKSLEVLMNDQGFQYVTRKMMGKEYLEEAFFIDFLDSYCSDYYNFLHGGEELNDNVDGTENVEEERSSPKTQANVVKIEELADNE